MRSFSWIPVLVCVFAGVVVAIAQITICQDCGWEVAEGLAKCGHCGKAVARKPEAPATESVPVPAVQGSQAPSESAIVSKEQVSEEVMLAREKLRGNDYELARMLLKNAAVLNLLSVEEDNRPRAEAIAEMLSGCDSRGVMVQVKCSTCAGKGNRVMRVGSLVPGEEQTREVQGSKCPMCKGTGIQRRVGTMDERKYSKGQAQARYTTIQRGRRYTKVGGAWLPADVSDQLTVKQKAMVMRTSAPPCEECLGFGKTDCEGCEAAGALDCEACDDGNVFLKVTAELTKMTLSRSEKCKKCKGKGLLLCSKCGGSGGVLCRECNGNGQRPECDGCNGEGYTGCKKCRGSGKVEDQDCEDCAGAGAELCGSCNGDGHR